MGGSDGPLITIEHSPTHRFRVILGGSPLELSYKAVGGRVSVEQLGEDGLAALIHTASTAIREMRPVMELQHYFRVVGIDSGIRILTVVDEETVTDYWRAVAEACRIAYGRCSFRGVLRAFTGTKATLGHSQGPILDRLKAICADTAVAEVVTGNIAILGLTSVAANDGITVRILCAQNNSIRFSINGADVIACSNRVGAVDADEILADAIRIRDTVFADGDLHQLTARYGGSYVLRIIAAVCPEQGLKYFESRAVELAKNSGVVIGRHLIESFNYAFSDRDLDKYTNQILDRIDALDIRRITDNDAEISSAKMRWVLGYAVGPDYRYRTFDYRKIRSPILALETRHFLADLYRDGTSVLQLARYYMLIRDAAKALEGLPMSSILDCRIMHAEKIKTVYFGSASAGPHAVAEKILETLGVLGRMYIWRWIDSGRTEACDNPFWAVSVNNASAYQHHIPPTDKDAIANVRANANQMPEAVALVIDLITATYLRAADACQLRIHNLRAEEKRTHLRVFTSKTQKYFHCVLPDNLAGRIWDYVGATSDLRSQLGDGDYVFVYNQLGGRPSNRPKPTLVNAGKIRYWCDKVGASTVTARAIRAEGGLNDMLHGRSAIERAKQLGNTPRIADHHYTTISSRSAQISKAKLMHYHYEQSFSGVLSAPPQRRQLNTPQNNPMWGMCDNPEPCRNRHICSNCACCQEVPNGNFAKEKPYY